MVVDPELDAVVAQVLAGDTEGYGRIVAATQEVVWRVVVQLLADKSTADELVQRTYIQAYEQLDRYLPGNDLVAWLVTIARNLTRNHLRDQARARRRLDLYREHLLSRAEDPASWMEEDDRWRSALDACRRALDGDAAEALRLCYEERLDIAGVADRIGRTPAATQKLLSRLRALLRDCILDKVATA